MDDLLLLDDDLWMRQCNYHIPFWKAYVNGNETNIIPVSNIQVTIMLDKGSNQVSFEYSRVLLRERLLKYIYQFK